MRYLISGALCALAFAGVSALTTAYHKPMTCHRDISISISGRYGLYETCHNSVKEYEHLVRYVDRFIDPVTGEIYS